MTSPTGTVGNFTATQLQHVAACLQEGRPDQAQALAAEFVGLNPRNIDGWLLLCRSNLALHRFGEALGAAERALALDPRHPAAGLLRLEALLRCGRSDEALGAARRLESEWANDASVILQVGYAYTQTNRHLDAARCYERVRVLRPGDAAVLHNLAGAQVALGALDKAESLYGDLLRQEPGAFDAYYNRATLRRQTPGHNHIAEMEGALARSGAGKRAEQVLCYSLAKELEDLGEWKRAFAYLKRGADAVRRSIPYRVDADVAMMEDLAKAFDEAFFARSSRGYGDGKPIFVLGMPRTGTTLVDRILSSHSTVSSVGESDEFQRALLRGTSGKAGSLDIQRALTLDWEAVGREFCRAVEGVSPGYPHLLDKTPNNFLHVGLILAALPNAKIVHLRRHPMDSCYAAYKVLFRAGYDYSYDLGDLGRYYLAYRRLMDHWRRVLQGRYLDVDYEDLVDDSETVSRRMIAFCGLDWEDACLAFDKNASPSFTASAAQVRRPVYKTSVALWRRYEHELEPLAQILRQGGIGIDREGAQAPDPVPARTSALTASPGEGTGPFRTTGERATMAPPTQAERSRFMNQLEQIDAHLQSGRPREAEAMAAGLVESDPGNVDGWIMLGRALLEQRHFKKALVAAEKAVALDPKHPVARMMCVDSMLRCGRNKEALEAAAALAEDRRNDPVVVLRVGNFYTRTNRHAEAARCYERARILEPANRHVVHNLVSAYIALGEIDKAVALLDGLLRKDPSELGAHYTRATLRKWTAETNHVSEMETVLAGIPAGDEFEPTLCFSLSKELEDLEQWSRAFAYLKRGADARRRLIAYDIENDLNMMRDVRKNFDASYAAEPRTGYAEECPIFVLGMPRSGTTLVDRIVTSHSKVGDVGESKEFGRSLARCWREVSGEPEATVEQARTLDPEALGRDFCRAVGELLPDRERLLDKTPLNFMYVGLIAKALPGAKIIHLRRNAMDSCYAVYKTLFREGYSFSYDLGEIGRYYMAYLELMDHWRRVFPGTFLDVDYEVLVEHQEDVSRRIIAFCGLDWEDACLAFEKNASPSLTASAAQVRRPIYKSSVGLWHRYERELEPLALMLKAGGVAFE